MISINVFVITLFSLIVGGNGCDINSSNQMMSVMCSTQFYYDECTEYRTCGLSLMEGKTCACCSLSSGFKLTGECDNRQPNSGNVYCCYTNKGCFYGNVLKATGEFSPSHIDCKQLNKISLKSGTIIYAHKSEHLNINGFEKGVSILKSGDKIQTDNGFDLVSKIEKVMSKEINIRTNEIFYVDGVKFYPSKGDLLDTILPAGEYNINDFVTSHSSEIKGHVATYNNDNPNNKRDISCWDMLS